MQAVSYIKSEVENLRFYNKRGRFQTGFNSLKLSEKRRIFKPEAIILLKKGSCPETSLKVFFFLEISGI